MVWPFDLFKRKNDRELLLDIVVAFKELAVASSDGNIPENLAFEVNAFIQKKQGMLSNYASKYPSFEFGAFRNFLDRLISDAVILADSLDNNDNKNVKRCLKIVWKIIRSGENIEEKIGFLKRKAA